MKPNDKITPEQWQVVVEAHEIEVETSYVGRVWGAFNAGQDFVRIMSPLVSPFWDHSQMKTVAICLLLHHVLSGPRCPFSQPKSNILL